MVAYNNIWRQILYSLLVMVLLGIHGYHQRTLGGLGKRRGNLRSVDVPDFLIFKRTSLWTPGKMANCVGSQWMELVFSEAIRTAADGLGVS